MLEKEKVVTANLKQVQCGNDQVRYFQAPYLTQDELFTSIQNTVFLKPIEQYTERLNTTFIIKTPSKDAGIVAAKYLAASYANKHEILYREEGGIDVLFQEDVFLVFSLLELKSYYERQENKHFRSTG